MNDKGQVRRSVVAQSRLPPMFPTHLHPATFWENLGRVIATFGFLEEVLGKAIFAFTATRPYEQHEIDEAYRLWLPQLEHALTDQLFKRTEAYEKAVKSHPEASITNLSELVGDIKKAAQTRNVLCHGSWRAPSSTGGSTPFFVNKKKEIFNSEIDEKFLIQTQKHVSQLACEVINSVTHMGWQFSGGSGLGKPIV